MMYCYHERGEIIGMESLDPQALGLSAQIDRVRKALLVEIHTPCYGRLWKALYGLIPTNKLLWREGRALYYRL